MASLRLKSLVFLLIISYVYSGLLLRRKGGVTRDLLAKGIKNIPYEVAVDNEGTPGDTDPQIEICNHYKPICCEEAIDKAHKLGFGSDSNLMKRLVEDCLQMNGCYLPVTGVCL